MRLTRQQAEAVRQAFGVGTDVWLFGSRVNDNKRGGIPRRLLDLGRPNAMGCKASTMQSRLAVACQIFQKSRSGV